MNEIRLSRGAHPAPFDEDGIATLCIQEYSAYLAAEPHSDAPQCVSLVLTAFMVPFNDALDDETRQKLRPYAVRQLGTRDDGQDEVRSCMALDWLIRTHTPAFLAAAGLTEEADKLRGLAAIEGLEEAQMAKQHVTAARDAAAAAARAAAGDAAWAAAGAAAAAAWAAATAAAGDAAWAAAWDAAAAATAAARAAAWDAAAAAARAAVLAPIVAFLQESAFELLDRMCDPAGIHDVEDEAALLEHAGRRND